MRKIVVTAVLAFAFLFTSTSVFAQDKPVKKEVKKETTRVVEKKDKKIKKSHCTSTEEKKACGDKEKSCQKSCEETCK
ncbi:MAG: hypothetical protein C4539_12685 [Ignavibacteriales bacterium]|nr:MAG: hypothetical protein C4539_12685 [Ignavibacteriales bacterium]